MAIRKDGQKKLSTVKTNTKASKGTKATKATTRRAVSRGR